ncbi:hypothetical protein [Streptomyces wedmorensis]|uniref:hypothetical protein n=1 Tax=Streptomyces wedmorensis TaxID=43759 RepID=UPI001428C94D|nr:hypothetical protein [Streptomyces wedmorensis]
MPTASSADRLRAWSASIGPRWSMMRSAADLLQAASRGDRPGLVAPLRDVVDKITIIGFVLPHD